MRQIKSIAINTFKETIRDKIYYSIFLFALFIVFITYFIGQLTYRDEGIITMDLGLAAINLVSVVISVFLGVTLVLKEIDRKSIYAVVSKPIARYKFIFGKYLGLIFVIFTNIFIMGLIVLLNVLVLKGEINIIFYQALALMFCEMLIVVAIAMFFSTFTTVTLASMFSIGFYLIAHASSTFIILSKKTDGIKHLFFKFLKVISPNFEVFNLKHLVPYVDMISGKIFFSSIFYSLIYVSIFLVASIFIFSRKDFK